MFTQSVGKGRGKAGYSPACANEWNRTFCGKPKVKCADCENRKLIPVTDEVIQNHLLGKSTIGIYPLRPDETCLLLAVDFDKKSWREDAGTYLETCKEMGIPAALERSRSGNGGHIWIFFDSPIQASLARKLGCTILTRAMERRHQIELDSYDRFFPNQDTMPKGGFGNLIALPLQRGPREKGNSVFINADFEAYPDQWEFLSSIKRFHPDEVESNYPGGREERASQLMFASALQKETRKKIRGFPQKPNMGPRFNVLKRNFPKQ